MGVAVYGGHRIFHCSQLPCYSSWELHKFKNVVTHFPFHRYATTISCTAPAAAASTSEKLSFPAEEIKARCKTWVWRGHRINYFTYPEPPGNGDPTSLPQSPLLLVHGFGASIAHWRRNIDRLSQNHTVYAIDLLGFGASDKPKGFIYSTEIWGQLILDFLEEIIRKPTVLIGNSVGSLACLVAAAGTRQPLIQGLVLLNCAGGMNNKAVVDDWRIKLLLPLFWLIDYLLQQRAVASFIFNRVKGKDSIKNVLLSVYGNQESVDEELVDIIWEPANDEGALDAFVSIVTGEPGPNPLQLMPKIQVPVLVLWGDRDPFTPLDGPVGKYFSSLPDKSSNFDLYVLEGVGHCPHDDRPELVHSRLLPWLRCLSTGNHVN